jgi:hypothetical protein
MQDFLETLLYIIIGIWIFRLIIKWAFPYILKFFVRRVTKKAQSGFEEQSKGPFQRQNDTRPHSKKDFKENKEKVGEYIDFEEID